MSDTPDLLFRDSWSSTPLTLLESIATPDSKAPYSNVVLATLEGPAMDYVNDTRNGRGYEELLCDKVITSEYVAELFATKNFLGEPDHPMKWEDRLDIHYPYVSHAIREVYKKPELGCYWVVVDILDTPNGRILKTLLDYGTQFGISSRGAGRTITRGNRIVVDPNTYRFITFDLVPMPGNKIARMKGKVNESIDNVAYSALSEQVEYLIESEDKASLESIKLVLSCFDNKECKSLVEKVDAYMGEGENNTFVTPEEDLLEAYNLISKLRSELSDSKLIIEGLNEKVGSLESDNVSLQNTNSELSKHYDKAKDLVKASLMNESSLRKDKALLTESVNSFKGEISKLNESIKGLNLENLALNSQVSNLRGLLNESRSQVSEQSANLNESLEMARGDLETVTSQLSLVSKRNRETLSQYFSIRCNQLGLNESLVMKKLGSDISDYCIDELESVLTESFKAKSGANNAQSKVGDISTLQTAVATYVPSGNIKRMNESEENDGGDAELDAIRKNASAVRGM